MGLLPQLGGDDPHGSAAAEKEHEGAEPAEEIHGRPPEMGHEQDGDEVEIALEHAFEPELGLPVLAGTVLDDLLADAAEPGLAGEDGDETVHLAVDLDGLDDLAAVSLETAIEIVEPDT